MTQNAESCEQVNEPVANESGENGRFSRIYRPQPRQQWRGFILERAMKDFIEALALSIAASIAALLALIFGLAATSVALVLPLIAIGAGLAMAYRLFCWIVGWPA